MYFRYSCFMDFIIYILKDNVTCKTFLLSTSLYFWLFIRLQNYIIRKGRVLVLEKQNYLCLSLIFSKAAGRFTEKNTVLQLFFLGFNNINGAELQKQIFFLRIWVFFQNLVGPLIKLFIVNTALFNQNTFILTTKQFCFTNSFCFVIFC